MSSDDALQLAAVLRDLLHTTRADQVSRRLCAGVRELVGADGATFVLREGDLVYYADEDAIDSLWKGRRFPASACISGWATIHRQTAIIDDIFADERIPVEAYRPTFVRSLAMTPMGSPEPTGALGAYWRGNHRATDRQVWLLEQLADAAAGALARSQAAPEPDPAEPLSESLVSRMLAVVAHDLRGPLSTIKQSASVLRRGGATRHEAIGRRIVRGVDEAARLVDQVLDYVRLERSGLPLRLAEVSVDGLCRSLAGELGSDGRAIQVDGGPLEGLCDDHRLRQAIGNLVRNALQYGDADQPVSVRVERDGDLGRIAIHNHGPAIPPEQQEALFEPFRRFSDTRANGSIGLGLYIADQIVRAHGGILSVASSELDGTTFTITVPLAPVMLEQPAAE